jgi:hypothetical protein
MFGSPQLITATLRPPTEENSRYGFPGPHTLRPRKRWNIVPEDAIRTDHEDDNHIFYVKAAMNTRSRDSSVGIVTRLRAGGREVGILFPAEVTGFLLLHKVQIGP